MKVSVIIPAINEEACVPEVLQGLQRVANQHPDYSMEIIVVNDHSTDRTADVSRANGARVVDNPGKPGKGRALITGFKLATGDLLIMMDADGSHLPEFIPDFVQRLEKGY